MWRYRPARPRIGARSGGFSRRACDTCVVEANVSPTTWDRYGSELRTGIVLLVAILVAAVASLSRAEESALSTPEDVRPLQGEIRGPEAAASSTTTTTVAAATNTAPAVTATPPPPASAPSIIVVNPAQPGTQPTATTAAPRRYDNGPVPPSVRIVSVSPSNAEVGGDVSLVFRGGDPDGFVAGWAVDWGDGSTTTQPYDIPCTPDPSTPDHEYPAVSHRYREIGDYRITVLFVTRGACGFGPGQQASDQRMVRVGVPLPV